MATVDISAGLLPPPQCYASEQQRLDAYAEALIAQVFSTDEWTANTVAPAPGSPLYWLRLDSNGNPVEVLKYNTSAPAGWARLGTQFTYGIGGGAANAYTLTLSPASPGVNQAYRTGACYAFIANTANTGATTLSVDGLVAKNVTKFGTTALGANDITANKMCVVVYDGTQFQLLNPNLNVSPANFAPGTDRQFLRTNSGPATVWESAYFTAEADWKPIPGVPGKVTFNHLLGMDPLSWSIGLVCSDLGGDNGYAKFDYVPASSVIASSTDNEFPLACYSNATEIGLLRDDDVAPLLICNKTTGVFTAIDTSKWKVAARAIR